MRSKFFTLMMLTSISFSFIFGGCGDGGGGGTTLTPTLVYTGNTDPAVITESNAASLVANVIGANPTTEVIAVQGAAVDRRASVKPTIVELLQGAVHTLSDALLPTLTPAGDAIRSIAAIEIDETEPCDSGSLTLTGTLDDNGTGSLSFSFNMCRQGDSTQHGEGTLQVDQFDMDLFEISDATMHFELLTLTDSVDDFSMRGSIRIEMAFDTNTEKLTVNAVVKDNNSGTMAKAENLVITTRYDDYFSPSNYSESQTGRLYDSVSGYVDIVTNEPFFFSSMSLGYPDSGGQMTLTGAANAHILFTGVSSLHARLELDLDGNGDYEIARILLWSELVEGLDGSYLTLGDGVLPQVVVDHARNINVLWSQSMCNECSVRFVRASADTLTFSSPITIGEAGSDHFPKMAVDQDDNIYVVYPVGNGDLLFTRSVDGGLSFATPTAIGNTSNRVIDMAADSDGNIFVLFAQGGPGSGVIRLIRSTDNGLTFVAPVDVASYDHVGYPFLLRIAAGPPGNIFVLWIEGDVRLVRSTDGGDTFSAPVVISGAFPPVYDPVGNLISADSSGRVYVTWGTGSGLYFSRSTDGGAIFSTPLRLGEANPIGNRLGIASNMAGHVGVVWQAELGGVFLSRSNDGGVTFAAPSNISDTGAGPHMALDDEGVAYVTWFVSTGSFSDEVRFTVIP